MFSYTNKHLMGFPKNQESKLCSYSISSLLDKNCENAVWCYSHSIECVFCFSRSCSYVWLFNILPRFSAKLSLWFFKTHTQKIYVLWVLKFDIFGTHHWLQN